MEIMVARPTEPATKKTNGTRSRFRVSHLKMGKD